MLRESLDSFEFSAGIDQTGSTRGVTQHQAVNEHADFAGIFHHYTSPHAKIVNCLRQSPTDSELVLSLPQEAVQDEHEYQSLQAPSSSSRLCNHTTSCSHVSLRVRGDATHAFYLLVHFVEADVPAEVLALNETTMSLKALVFEDHSPVHLEIHVHGQGPGYACITLSCLEDLDVIRFRRVFLRAARSLVQGGCGILDSSQPVGACPGPALINSLSSFGDHLDGNADQFEVDGPALLCMVLRETTCSHGRGHSYGPASHAAACLATAVETCPQCWGSIAHSFTQRTTAVTRFFMTDGVPMSVQFPVAVAIRTVSTKGELPTEVALNLLSLIGQLILIGTPRVVHRELTLALHGLRAHV